MFPAVRRIVNAILPLVTHRDAFGAEEGQAVITEFDDEEIMSAIVLFPTINSLIFHL